MGRRTLHTYAFCNGRAGRSALLTAVFDNLLASSRSVLASRCAPFLPTEPDSIDLHASINPFSAARIKPNEPSQWLQARIALGTTACGRFFYKAFRKGGAASIVREHTQGRGADPRLRDP